MASFLAMPFLLADGPVGSIPFPALRGKQITTPYCIDLGEDPVFDLTGLAKEDFRRKGYTLTRRFPSVFHYKAGGATSEQTYPIGIWRITSPTLSPAVVAILKSENVDVATVPVYYLKAILAHPLFNWFTHPYFMTEMLTVGEPLPTVTVVVKSGVFEGKNLMAVENQMGMDHLVPQTLTFHDACKLSGNVAKIEMVDPSQPASGCFVSVCGSKAIVVYVDFTPPPSSS
jgi:hypothetical protein